MNYGNCEITIAGRSQPCRQLQSKLPQRGPHSCFHCFHRHTLHLDDLSIRELVPPAEQKAFANRLAQRVHGIAYRGIELPDPSRHVSWRRLQRNRFVAHDGFESPDIAVMPDGIERAIPDGAKQVCFARHAGVEDRAPPPQFEEDILHDVLSRARASKHRFRETDEWRIVPAKQSVEGAFVTVPDALQKLYVVHGNGRVSSFELRRRRTTIGS